MKTPFLILILALFSSLAFAAPSPKPTPVPLDRLIALVDQADAQRNEALAGKTKAEKQVIALDKYGRDQWQRAEDEKAQKEKYKGSRVAFFGSGFVLGGFILLLVGLAVGSGVLARLVPEKKPEALESVGVFFEEPACTLPPSGWECSRAAGHDGPCAASPVGESGDHDGSSPSLIEIPAPPKPATKKPARRKTK